MICYNDILLVFPTICDNDNMLIVLSGCSGMSFYTIGALVFPSQLQDHLVSGNMIEN